MRTTLIPAACLTLLLANAVALPAGAQDAQPPGDPAAIDRSDPCQGEGSEQEAQIDRLRRGVSAGICSTSRWFDGLFGDAREYTEAYQDTYGRVGVGLAWDKIRDLQFDGHFRANIHLPALGNRFNAVIGRESEETFINDNFDDVGFLPGSFSEDRESDWYAGINYNALKGTNSRFDISGGLQVKSPLNPYVKARYRHYFYPGERFQIGTRATGFWENIDGFGATLAVDADWSVSEGAMLRWANTVTRSEATDGARWKSRLIWFQALSEKSAMRYEIGIRGETGGFQPDLYGAKVTYRRSVWRDWLFVETFGGAFRSRDEDPDKRCDACATAGIGFEMMFGERYDSGSAGGAAAGP